MKPIYFFLFISFLFYACNKDETPRPFVEITSFTLQGIGEFELKEDVVLLLDSLEEYRISVNTNPEDAFVKFAIGHKNEFGKLKDPVFIGYNINKISFIAEKGNYRQSSPISIMLSQNAAPFLKELEVSPNPDIVKISMADNSRGIMIIAAYNMNGKRIFIENILKQQNKFQYEIDISGYDSGNYFLILSMGADKRNFRFIKV